MKKVFFALTCIVLVMLTIPANASAESDFLRIGLRHGADALFSANLENYQNAGWGYSFGWFNEDDSFTPIGYTGRNAISMTGSSAFYMAEDGNYSAAPVGGASRTVGGWFLQLDRVFPSFAEAEYAASLFEGAFPAFIGGEYRVRMGGWASQAEAEAKLGLYVGTTWQDASYAVYDFAASVVTGNGQIITVTVTRSTEILFQFDCSGHHFAVVPDAAGAPEAVTWFKGYRYRGAFEYRLVDGMLTVINLVGLEDYVKGVIPYEMSPSWPLEALKAQAVCARTYAMRGSRHSSAGFDLCNTTDCQVYYGVGSSNEVTDRAVEETAGVCIWYQGKPANAVYCSSNGGAVESAENIWGGKNAGYLAGKVDPYEALTTIPNYSYEVTYTTDELTAILQSKGYSIGPVKNIYISRYSDVGNVLEVTVTDTYGGSIKLTGERCRLAFNDLSSGKNVRSSRYIIAGGDSDTYAVNDGSGSISGIGGKYVISGSGTTSFYTAAPTETYIITGRGVEVLKVETGLPGNVFTIRGTGYGHNVGMSQYGAKAMAEQGMAYTDILNFYYTDITLGESWSQY